MKLFARSRGVLRAFLLGQSGYLTAFDLPLHSPQTEVAVWIHGLGEPRDVTNCHSVACPMPSILCVAFENDEAERAPDRRSASLHFVEGGRGQRLLGRINLRYDRTIHTTGPDLRLYRATDCIETCLPLHRSWIRSVCLALERWKGKRTGHVQIQPLDSCCNEVVFFCPRPVVLVSMLRGDAGNIFPMNLMGQVSKDHFVFALNRSKKVGAAIADHSEVAISTVPFDQAEVVRALGTNHHHAAIDFRQLPFSTHLSSTLNIPVPDFALTVRELRMEQILPLGSHDFFIARIVDTQVHATASEFYRIHGLYAACRK